jgi:hypothetical protein
VGDCRVAQIRTDSHPTTRVARLVNPVHEQQISGLPGHPWPRHSSPAKGIADYVRRGERSDQFITPRKSLLPPTPQHDKEYNAESYHHNREDLARSQTVTDHETSASNDPNCSMVWIASSLSFSKYDMSISSLSLSPASRLASASIHR